MNEQGKERTLPTPRWLAWAIVALLSGQMVLLWLQGSLLQRQHGDLQALRQDVQDLADAVEGLQDSFDPGAPGESLQPSRHRPARRRGAVVRVLLQEGDSDQGVRKELENQRKAEREAVEKARETQEKLSLAENARKAEEKARLQAEGRKVSPLLWIGAAVLFGAVLLRSWLRRRG